MYEEEISPEELFKRFFGGGGMGGGFGPFGMALARFHIYLVLTQPRRRKLHGRRRRPAIRLQSRRRSRLSCTPVRRTRAKAATSRHKQRPRNSHIHFLTPTQPPTTPNSFHTSHAIVASIIITASQPRPLRNARSSPYDEASLGPERAIYLLRGSQPSSRLHNEELARTGRKGRVEVYSTITIRVHKRTAVTKQDDARCTRLLLPGCRQDEQGKEDGEEELRQVAQPSHTR